MLLAFVALGLVYAVLCQEIGWEEYLWNDLFCVQWDVKPWINHWLRFYDKYLILMTHWRCTVPNFMTLFAVTSLCPCGKRQTIFHIFTGSPQTQLEGVLQQFHLADSVSVQWLQIWLVNARNNSMKFIIACLGAVGDMADWNDISACKSAVTFKIINLQLLTKVIHVKISYFPLGFCRYA